MRPDDGQDLIQGFFADEWAGVARRYEPLAGDVEPYVFQAFYRYAVRQVTREARHRARLVDPETLAQWAGASSDPSGMDQERLREAVASLPAGSREALEAFVRLGSARAAAGSLGLGRYRFQTVLAEALAQIALALGPPPHLNLDDWAVSELVLRGRTVGQAARARGLSASEARAVHNRTLRQLLVPLFDWFA